MKRFTKRDVKNLLADLELYCGTIKQITNIHGPHNDSGGHFGGTIHTWMDEFRFTAVPFLSGEDTWCIQLPDPAASLRDGHILCQVLTFPKLYKNPELQRRYRIANAIYHRYNAYSGVTEKDRLLDLERQLGYDNLPRYTDVSAAIVKDYRSHQQKKQRQFEQQSIKN